MRVTSESFRRLFLNSVLLTACQGGELSEPAHHHHHGDGATANPHAGHSEMGTLSLAQSIPTLPVAEFPAMRSTQFPR